LSILGIYDGHNAGAALVSEDGTVVAAVEEERFSRIKNHDSRPDHDAPPRESVAFCVYASAEPIRAVAFGIERPEVLGRLALANFDRRVAAGQPQRLRRGPELGVSERALRALPEATQRRRVETLRGVVDGVGLDPNLPVAFVDHHAAHAGGAYFLSGADRALVVTLDGKGDDLSGSVSHGGAGQLTRSLAMPTEDSLGHLYSAFTVACGLRPQRDEGKLQAMAASGKEKPRIRDWLETMFELDQETGAIRGHLNDGLVVGPYPDRLPDLHNEVVRRLIDGVPIEDAATTVQSFVEDIVSRLVSWHVKRSGLHTVVVAGGLFANVSLNRHLAELPDVAELHVHPAMTDAGVAMGAAAVAAVARGISLRPLESLDLGPAYPDAESATAFVHEGYRVSRPPVPAEKVLATSLARGEVVARFVGGAEYGPRALGQRSILAPATDRDMPAILNRMLHRSNVMPFAPMARRRDAGEHFADVHAASAPARYMTVALECTAHTRSRYPAIVHIDGTARPQLLDDTDSAIAVLDELQRLTGDSIVINTSFNLHDEPMVCRPEDAARTARAAGIRTVQVGSLIGEFA
jgi:carbamoyltransferase